MPGFDEIVGKYLPQNTGQTLSEVKQREVATAATDKQSTMTGQELTPYQMAAARLRGGGVESAVNDRERDMLTMSPGQLFLKYGQEGISMASQANSNVGRYSVQRHGVAPSFAQQAQDTTRDVGVGFVNGIVDIGALAGGVVSPQLGGALGSVSQGISEWNEDLKSEAYKGRQEAYQARQDVDSRDNEAEYEANKEAYGTLAAKAMRIGSDAIDAAGNTLEDGYLTSSITANGMGSLFVGGPVAKGLGLAGKAALRGAMEAGLVGRAGARTALRAGAKLAMPAAVGLQEGAGTYRQTYMDAMLELSDRTDLTQAQKQEMANTAALAAAGPTALVAGGIGKLPGFSHLEEAPFKVGSVKGALANIGKETLEEGLQSASGQLNENAALKLSGIDPDRDITEGVGEQAAQGAIGGLGMSGVVQAPGLAARGTVEGAKLAWKGAKWAVSPVTGAITRNAADVRSDIAAANPGSAKRQAEDFAQAVAAAPEADAAVREAVTNSQATPEEKTEAFDYLDSIMAAAQYDPAGADHLGSEKLVESLDGSTDKFDAIQRAAKLAGDEEADFRDRMAAGRYLLETTDANEALIDKYIPKAIKDMPEDHPHRDDILRFHGTVAEMAANQSAMQMFHGAIQLAAARAAMEAAPTTEQEASDLQDAVSLVGSAVERDTALAPKAAVDGVLKQVRDGNATVTPTQLSALEGAEALHNAVEEAETKAKAQGLSNINAVSSQILSEESDAEGSHKSMEEHLNGINAAIKAGRDDLAADRLNSLSMFARHMQNKVRGINAALAGGNTHQNNAVPYRVLTRGEDGSSKFRNIGKAYIQPASANSVEFAQKVALEAAMLGTLANNLATIHGHLGVKHVELASLDPALEGDSHEISKKYKQAAKRVPGSATGSQGNAAGGSSGDSSNGNTGKATSRVTPEQAQRLTDTGLQARIIAMADKVLTDQDKATLAVLNAEVARRKEASKPAVSKITPEQAQKLSDDELSDLMEEHYDTLDPVSQATFAVLEAEAKRREDQEPETLNVWAGTKENAQFSNLSERPFVYQGREYRSVEQAYQSLKSGTFDQSTYAKYTKPNMKIAGRLGTNTETNIQLMEDLMKASFEQNPDALAALKATGDIEITHVQDKGIWAKEFPRILMDIRANTEAKPAEDLSEMETAYPTLIGQNDDADTEEGNIRNWFRRVFRPAKEGRPSSRLVGEEAPLSFLAQILGSASRLSDLIGKEKGNRLNSKVVEGYKKYMTLGNEISKRLEERIADVFGTKDGKYLVNQLLAGKESNRIRRGLLLNLMESDGKNFRWNPALKEAAVAATLQYILTMEGSLREVEDRDIAKALGISEDEVTNDHRNLFQKTLSTLEVKTRLADMIRQFWGVEGLRDQPMTYVNGIPEAAAAEIMEVLRGLGILEVEKTETQALNDRGLLGRVKSLNRLTFENMSKKVRDLIDGVREYPSAIQDAILTEPEEITYLDTPPKGTPRSQMNNPDVALTNEERSVVRKNNEQPHGFNFEFHDLLADMDEEGYMAVVGDDVPEKMNDKHRQSVEGRNRARQMGYRYLRNLRAQLTNKAAADGKQPKEVKIFYGHNFNKVGRLQMLGKATPQSNKTVRAVVGPNGAKLDMLKREHSDAFMLALAQALGIKVHQMPRDIAIQKAQAVLDANEVAVEAIREWMSTGKITTEIVQDLQQIRDPRGNLIKPSEHALQALFDYARYQEQAEARADTELDEDETKTFPFETQLYLEADGMTNGPAMALMMYSIGEFTIRGLQRLRKTGFFAGYGRLDQDGTLMTAGEQYGRDPVDLYKSASNIAESTFAEMLENLRNGVFSLPGSTGKARPDVLPFATALTRVMEKLLGGFEVQYDETGGAVLTVGLDRGVVKNPLTVKLYGSSDKGIASKLTTLMLNEMYAKHTEALNSPEAMEDFMDILGDLELLMGNKLVFNKKDGLFQIWKAKDIRAHTGTPRTENFAFSPSQTAQLRAAVQELFVPHLTNAIKTEMGDTIDVMDNIRASIQVQSIYLQHIFNQRVQEMLDAKEKSDPNYKKGDFLSENELKEIRDSLKFMAPYVETDNQRLSMEGSMQSGAIGDNEENIQFGSSLSDTFQTDGMYFAPGNASVRGIPFMTIGPGDGNMILHVFMGKDAVVRVLPVFDGVNMSLDRIDQDSVKINKSAAEAALSNPLRSLAEQFRAFVNNTDVVTLLKNEEEKAKETKPKYDIVIEIAKAMYPGDTDSQSSVNSETIAEQLKRLAQEIEEQADDIDARHAAIEAVGYTVDHMAAASRPYSLSKEFDGYLPSDEEIRDALNREYRAQKQGNEVDKLTAAGPNSLFHDGNTQNVDVLTERVINSLDMTDDQKALMRDAVSSLLGSGLRIVYDPNNDPTDYGTYSPGQNMLFLHKNDNETLLHELIHAATFNTVLAHYMGYGNPAYGVEKAQAIERLEVLMNQWLNEQPDTSAMTPEARAQFDFAKAEIERSLADTDEITGKAKALNEFMAWVLANQTLTEVAKRQTVKDRAARIMGAALGFIKKLIWGGKRAPKVSDDMLSNIRFNTQILMAGNQPSTLYTRNSQLVLKQDRWFGNDDRVTRVREAFNKKVAIYLHGAAPTNNERQEDMNYGQTRADQLASDFIASGFSMTPQERFTFQSIVGALATSAKFDANVMNRLQELYDHAISNLYVNDFAPDITDPDAQRIGALQLDAITNGGKYLKDKKDRSLLLPSFLALAMVNDQFRQILSGMELPAKIASNYSTADQALESLGNKAMDSLGRLVSGEKRNNRDVMEAVDNMVHNLIDSVEQQENFAGQTLAYVSHGLAVANDYTAAALQSGTKKLAEAGRALEGKYSNKATKTIKVVTSALNAMVDEKSYERMADDAMSLSSRNAKLWHGVREAIAEAIGRTASNAFIFDRIKPIRHLISKGRERFREWLPGQLESHFTEKLSDEHKTHLFKGVLKTDLMALKGFLTLDKLKDLLRDPSKAAGHISKLEDQIKSLDLGSHKWIISQTKLLGDYMATGKYVSGHTNPHAIADLLGIGDGRPGKSSDALIKAIDNLASLYAFDALPKSHKDTLSSLVQNEEDGMNFLLSYVSAMREDEMAKLTEFVGTAEDEDGNVIDVRGKGYYNYHKGYAVSEKAPGAALIVADDEKDHDRLRLMGYTRLGDYKGSAVDFTLGKRGYYYVGQTGNAAYHQGVLQTVRPSAFGADPVTGYSHGPLTAGAVADLQEVIRIQRRLKGTNLKSAKGENLRPLYNGKGEVYAYERMIDPEMNERVERSTDIFQMTGAWKGRQYEEGAAAVFNEEIVGLLHDRWMEDKGTKREAEYINAFDPKEWENDPVLKKSMEILPLSMRKQIEGLFGKDGFRVNRGGRNDTFGYHGATVGDFWTGSGRWSDATNRKVQDMAISIFGAKAYQTLINAERQYQKFMSDARKTIIIKSVVVPIANAVSGIYQLMAQGVPIDYMRKNLPRKLSEIHAYIGQERERMKLDTELSVAEANNNRPEILRLEARIQSIKDNQRRLSIWPLIEAGEFGSISEGLEEGDVDLLSPNFSDKIEALVDKLPKPVRTLGRYAHVSQTTALFKGLQKATDYSDFIGKALLYDHRTGVRGLSSKEAIARVSEAFINYDRLNGRTRQYSESMGLTWFMKFKIRAMKVALSMIRENPLNVFISTLLPVPHFIGSIGTPVTDNLLVVGVDGNLGYSIGPGQAIHSYTMNPWINGMQAM